MKEDIKHLYWLICFRKLTPLKLDKISVPRANILAVSFNYMRGTLIHYIHNLK